MSPLLTDDLRDDEFPAADRLAAEAPTIARHIIEAVTPSVDGGRYPVKRIVEDDLAVEADVFKDGHDVVAAALKWRLVGEPRWYETAMSFVDNDRWRGICSLNEIGVYEYTVEAWTDTFRSWRDEFTKKFEAGISDLTAETLEGAALIEAAGKRAHVADDSARLCELSECIRTADHAQINNIVRSGELEVLMATYPDRSWATQYAPPPRVIVNGKRRKLPPGMNFFHARPKVAAIADRHFVIVCPELTTRERWAST